jgi:hypothetical protein
VAAVAVHGAAALEESVDVLHKLGRKGAGGVGLLGAALDVDEVWTAKERCDQIKQLVIDIEDRYEYLMRLLKKFQPQLQSITKGLKNLEQAFKDEKEGSWYTREARDKEMQTHSYSGNQPKAWRAAR